MAPGSDSGALFAATATHATSAVATVTGVAGKKMYITSLSGSSDKAGALILVSDGGTIIWQDRVSNTAGYTISFDIAPLVVTSGNTLTVTVDGTAMCNANVAGYTL